MPNQRLSKCEIRWSKRNKSWELKFPGNPTPEASSEPGITKVKFIRHVAVELQGRVYAGAYGFSLRIKKKNGEYADELTVPKSKDPRGSKG